MPTDPEIAGPGTKPSGWKRQPLAMWLFLAMGAGRIIMTGIGLVLVRRRR